MTYDSILIGGGHNSLACAAYLAKAGKKVLVLERRHVLGGAAVTDEIYPGFRYSVCSYVVSLLRPQIIRDLELPRHGLEILPLECSFTPQLEGPGLCRWPESARTREEIMRYSAKDADRYPEFGKEMMKMARWVKPIIDMVPPDPTSFNPTHLKSLYDLGQRV
ncbi:MAG: NAD(P)-binding protein, partial [Myxococcota bacterium]|nr:NAD(P)-binding protein [Myxococcota bacterium]